MDFVEQVKSSANIVDVIQEHVRLRPSGPSRYMGLCPFHNEKKPSFTVHAVHQFYKCFSCGAAGDVFKFVMETQGISFYEALKQLAERYGIPMPKRSQYADEEARARGALLAMHEIAAGHFRENLAGAAGEGARAYLERRGVAAGTIEHFGLGYSAANGRALLRLLEQSSFPAAQIEQSGLVGKRQDGGMYDWFRNRLMFPIHNEAGKAIAFGGRALAADEERKYLNSPETPIYKKSHVLYNLHRAKEGIRKEDRVILVEGYMDAIGVTAAGFLPVIASCGTALTAQQVQSLKRHSRKIAVNFDPDAAGANAAERSINLLLEEGMQVRIMELDGDLDPDEYCKQRGAAAYEERLDQAKGYFYWLADRARARHNVHTSEGIVAVLQFLLPAVQRIADPLERSAIANDLAGYIGVERGMLLDSFRKAAANRNEKAIERPRTAIRPDERMLLNALLADPEMRGELMEELKSIEAISRFRSWRIFQAMFTLHDSGGRFTFEQVHARVEEGDQNLLAEAVLSEDAAASREEVLAAIASMRRSETENRRSEIKRQIRDAERAGNLEEALRLTAGLQELDREAKGRR